ncbi:MAG: hypothetical protein RL077_1624 [Verrucomicrobiota bacterium]
MKSGRKGVDSILPLGAWSEMWEDRERSHGKILRTRRWRGQSGAVGLMETSTGKPRRRVGPGGRGPRSAGAGRGVRAAGIAGAGRRVRAERRGRGSAGAGRRARVGGTNRCSTAGLVWSRGYDAGRAARGGARRAVRAKPSGAGSGAEGLGRKGGERGGEGGEQWRVVGIREEFFRMGHHLKR